MVKKHNNPFGEDLIQCAGFALKLSESDSRLPVEPAGEDRRVEKIYRAACIHYERLCRRVENAFVTPLDRRDLLALFAAFQGLNRALWSLELLGAPVDPIRPVCQALLAAAAAWSPLGSRTDRPLPHLQKAVAAADTGAREISRQAEGARRTAVCAGLQRAWETADVFIRVILQNE